MCCRFVIFIGLFLFDRCVTAQNFITVPNSKGLTYPYVPQVSLKMCLLKPDPGPCRANVKSYFFNSSDMQCYSFEWGGCQGNGNRFDSSSECYRTCLTRRSSPKKQPRYCQLTFDYGFCFGDLKRWYYDRVWKVCKETIYSGCGGNKNNFYNKEQCDSICTFGKGSKSGLEYDKGGIRKVIYVYTNTTKAPRTTRDTSGTRFTSPSPRYGRNYLA